MSVAQILEPLIRSALGDQLAVGVRAWDGSYVGPPEAPVTIQVHSRRALRRLLWAPSELGFSRAYVCGDVDIEGDLLTALGELDKAADATMGPGITVTRDTLKALARAVLRLRVVGPPPKPPAEEIRLRGRLHTPRRDSVAVTHHYDVGNDFYALVLGDSMTYSCAYWEHEPSAGFGLADAQRAKCDLIARKLGVQRGMRVLDVGCGWGTFARHVASEYGAHVVGVTLSQPQAEWARHRAKADGLDDLVEIRVQDYRDVSDGPYDAIASIGMAEHVGAAMLPTYSAALFTQLRPGGRLLNHAIARRPGPVELEYSAFIDRYVFPDGELHPMSDMVQALEEAGFEVRDVESLREHYATTLRAWLANLEANWDEAVRLTSRGRARVWRLYMAASALSFDANRNGINQILAVRPGEHGASGMPTTRAAFLG